MKRTLERRRNWKQNLSEAASKRQEQRHTLLIELEAVRETLKTCGSNFALYDDLKAKQRGIIAQLAKLHY